MKKRWLFHTWHEHSGFGQGELNSLDGNGGLGITAPRGTLQFGFNYGGGTSYDDGDGIGGGHTHADGEGTGLGLICYLLIEVPE